MTFSSRDSAGRRLGEQLKKCELDHPIVIGLPRGGVPVAAQVAATLRAPLDVLVVRKIGAPFQPEFGIGAITETGYFWLNQNVIRSMHISASELKAVQLKERNEVNHRVELYRRGRPLSLVQNRDVILVDDGLATGSTALVAARYLRQLGAKYIILAIPVAAKDTIELLIEQVDDVFCLRVPERFTSVGEWYSDFSQTTDQEVIDILSHYYAPPETPSDPDEFPDETQDPVQSHIDHSGHKAA